MFKKAFIPRTNEVPATGIAVTIGFPLGTGSPVFGLTAFGSGLYPKGWASSPEKMAASRTEMNVKNADAVANFERALNVLGREHTQQMIVATTAKTMVH